jgi:heme exporter protein B
MLTFIAHELKFYFKNKQEAIYIYSYFISMLVLVPFAGNYEPSKLQSLAAITLWVALASAISMGAGSLFKRDYDQGRLEYYQLLPLSMELMVAAKWFGFFLFVLVPLWATIPLAGLLYGLSLAEMGRYAVGLLAGAMALSILSTLVAALTSGLAKAGAVLSLLLLPLAIPVLIFGASYCLSTGNLLQPSLWFLIGFSGFMLPIMCFAGAYSIRASN